MMKKINKLYKQLNRLNENNRLIIVKMSFTDYSRNEMIGGILLLFNYKHKRIFILFISCLFVTLLAGCFGPSPEEQIYTTLEEVVKLEGDFEKQQAPLLELEKKESEIYNQIIDLGMDEFNKVVELSKEAVTLVEDREAKIDSEYESIMASKKEFESIDEQIEQIEDKDLLEKANQLKDTMDERYSAYEELYKLYKNSITLDKELYTMLQKEDLSIEDLEAQTAKINETYQKVMEKNESFNKFTEQYNQEKMDFYKAAEFNVKETDE